MLDLGASFHATPCKEYFKNLHTGDFGKIFLGNNKSCDVIGKGDVLIKLTNRDNWLLLDVRYIPQLKQNLISAGQLASQGCEVTCESNKWKVTKGALLIAWGNIVGTLYIVEGNVEVGVSHSMPNCLLGEFWTTGKSFLDRLDAEFDLVVEEFLDMLEYDYMSETMASNDKENVDIDT